MLGQVKLPLDELQNCSPVVVEAPATAEAGFENKVRSLVERAQTRTKRICVIVQPSYRKRGVSTVWVTRWNHQDPAPPFKL